jgi:plasmid stabilization system protein ParE
MEFMALKIVWSFRAKDDIRNISIYWNKRIGNSNYSKKIRRLTNEYLELLQQYPKLGKQTDNNLVREIIIREFKIFYSIDETSIYIVRFWDTRQEPEKLKL